MSYREEAEALYEQHYKGRGLAPKHVAAIKDVMAKALKKGEKPRRAVKEWLTAHDVELEAKAKSDGESDEDEPKKEKAKPKAPEIDFSKIDLKHLDRKSLKATITTLLDAGVAVNVPRNSDGSPKVKKLDDATLLSAVNTALTTLPSPESLSSLERIDPRKLKTELNQDCLGIFVDLRTAACQTCYDKSECAKKFIENLHGDFSMFKAAQVDIKTEEAASKITDEEADAVSKQEGSKKRRLKYEPDLTVFVMNVPNPNKKSSAEYPFLADIIAYAEDAEFAAISLGEFFAMSNKLGKKHLKVTFSEDEFMKEIIPVLRENGVVKLEDDLSKKQRKAYKAALDGASGDDEEEEDDE